MIFFKHGACTLANEGFQDIFGNFALISVLHDRSGNIFRSVCGRGQVGRIDLDALKLTELLQVITENCRICFRYRIVNQILAQDKRRIGGKTFGFCQAKACCDTVTKSDIVIFLCDLTGAVTIDHSFRQLS